MVRHLSLFNVEKTAVFQSLKYIPFEMGFPRATNTLSSFGPNNLLKEPLSPGHAKSRVPWLGKLRLFSFAFFFILCALGLALMGWFVPRNQGISLALTDNHYAWTYGPTAILVIVVALWRRVNYFVMINQPWQELENGPHPASNTVLLDYLSPLQIQTLALAFGNKHFPVALSTLVFLILKTIILLSTILFSLEARPIRHDVDIRHDTRFDASALLNTTTLGFGDGICREKSFGGPLNPAICFEIWPISPKPAWDYSNLLAEDHGAPHDIPVSRSVAFTNFTLASPVSSPLGKVSATVDVFEPNITCETVPVTRLSTWERGFSLEFETSSCVSGDLGIVVMNYMETKRAGIHTVFTSQKVNCTGHGLKGPVFPQSEPNTYQYLFVSLRGQTWPDGHVVKMTNLSRIAAVSCSLGYSISKRTAIALGSKMDSLELMDELLPRQETHLPGLTDLIFSETVMKSLEGLYLESVQGDPMPGNWGSIAGHSISLLLNQTSRYNPKETIHDPELLRTSIQEILSGISQQLARHYLLLPDEESFGTAVAVLMEKRLQTRSSVLWLMAGFFAVAAFLVFALNISITLALPECPATLASNAAILSRSASLALLVRDCGSKSMAELDDTLCHHDFCSVHGHDSGLFIQAVGSRTKATSPTAHNDEKSGTTQPILKSNSGWMPFSSHKYGVFPTLLLPVAFIIALEILWYFSKTNENFITISYSSGRAQYAVGFGSTAVVFLIANLFNSLEFAIATMVPFSCLATMNGRNESPMLVYNFQEAVLPFALYKSFINKHWDVAASLAASLVGGTLTIMVSGLWFLDTTVHVSNVSGANVSSGWLLDFSSFKSFDPAGYTFADIQKGAHIHEPLVWNDQLVLPAISHSNITGPAVNNEVTNVGNSKIYNFTMFAVQPALNCSRISEASLIPEASPTDPFGGELMLQLRSECRGMYRRRSEKEYFGFTRKGVNRNSYIYYQQVYHSEWQASLFGTPATTLSPELDCPSFGLYVSDTNKSDDAFQAYGCTQRFNSVLVTVTYETSPRSTLVPTDVFINTSNFRTLADPFSEAIFPRYPFWDEFTFHAVSTEDGPYSTDNFFENLMSAPSGLTRDELSNPELLLPAANRLYQKYMVHIIDKTFRTYNLSGDNPHLVPASNDGKVYGTSTETVTRLKMSEPSKIALQAAFGTMFILGSLAYYLVDMRNVLPRNPYSIASQMALFGGSKLLEQPGASGMSPEELVRGKSFRLGWWDYEEEEEEVEGGGSNNGGVNREREGNEGREDDGSNELLMTGRRRRFGIDFVKDAETESV